MSPPQSRHHRHAPASIQLPETLSPALPTVIGWAVLAGWMTAGWTAEPLAEPSAAPRGEPRFRRVPAAESGLDFVYRWTPPQKYDHELVNAVTGGGACAGDIDGDGLPDAFLSQPFAGNRLYRNLGGLRFEDVTDKAGLAGSEGAAWGTGAAFADVDGDGDLDLFVCGYDCPNRLHLNDGKGAFREVAAAAGLDTAGAAVMMAFADYDRDGDLDGYLVANHIAPREAPLWQYEVRQRDGMPILPDHLKGIARVLYRPDLREGKLIPAGERDRLYRNDGVGADGVPRFTDVTDDSGLEDEFFGLAATWWDADHDGWPDLYVSNDFWGPDLFYRNNGDGTFTNVTLQALPHTPWFSMGSDVADVDNDGLLDFMASDMSSTTHYKQKLSMGDMQGWFLVYARPLQYMRNALYINTGTGRFQEAAFLAGLDSTDWTWSLKFADLDNDGRTDLFVSNGAERFWDNSDLMKEARGAQRIDTPELKAVWLPQPKRDDPNLAFRNLGDLAFEEMGDAWGLGDREVSYGAAFADFDRDGDVDLLVNNFDNPAALYENRSSGPAERGLLVRLRGRGANPDGIGALLRAEAGGLVQTQYLTSARGFMSANEPVAHFGLGSAPRLDRLEIRWPSGTTQVVEDLAAAHFHHIDEPDPGHGTPDPTGTIDPPPLFAYSDTLERAGKPEREFDDFARQPLLPNQLSKLGPGIALADLDGNGFDDLFLGRSSGNVGSVFFHSGKVRDSGDADFVIRSFRPFDADTEREDAAPVFFDADGDGDLDLFVGSGGVECEAGDERLRDRLYVNQGAGRFAPAPAAALPDRRAGSGPAAVADFDRDGDLDLFVGGRVVPGAWPTSPESRLLRNESSSDAGLRFVDVTDEAAPALRRCGMVSGALWSDVDGDGQIDLLVAREWAPVGVFLNDGEGRLRDVTEAAGLSADHSGWWNSVAGADLDGDGDIDYVAGNFGLNTKYHHPTPQAPAQVYYGDLDGTGSPHIVEAKVASGTLLPVRGKSCSQRAMPGLKARFPTFDSFARATLPEIYEDARLAGAQRFEAADLRSVILWNESVAGAPRLRPEPLPRIAQIAPVFGIVLEDVDSDGLADIVLTGNFFSPQPETGRMDGGVGTVLINRGGQRFEPLRADRSGLVAPEDCKGMAVTDMNRDGRPDLIVAPNSSPVKTFLNRGTRGRPQVVQLDPSHAPGAIATATLADGTERRREFAAGSGYWSQSAPRWFLGLPEGTAIDAVRVRWSDGTESKHDGPFAEPVVHLAP